MNPVKTTGTLGIPVEVNVATIEKELLSFWKSADEDDTAVLRACSCNLLAIVQNREEAEAFPPILIELAEWYPSRSIIAYPESGVPPAQSDASGMRAWISAQCSTPLAGGLQICS